MARRTVTAPDGGEWRVRRLWAPRLQGETLWARAWRRVRGTVRRTSDAGDVLPDGCEPDLEALVVFLVLIVVVLVLLFVAIPLLVALIDLVLILLLTVLGIAARIVFRRPWVVEAVGPDGARWRWRVVGWRASGRAVEDIAAALAHGHPPQPGDGAVLVTAGSGDGVDRPPAADRPAAPPADRPAAPPADRPAAPPADQPPPPPADGGGSSPVL